MNGIHELLKRNDARGSALVIFIYMAHWTNY